jgi:hypothetical protein
VATIMGLSSVSAPAAMADDENSPVIAQGDGLDTVTPPEVYKVIYVEGTTDADTELTTVTTAKTGTITPVKGVTWDVISTPNLLPDIYPAPLASGTGYSCVKNTSATSPLRAMTPAKVDVSDNDWEVHYVFHFYSMSRARYISGQWTTQLEQCAVGGTRNKHGNQRLANTESQMSINNAYDRRLGQAWGTQVSSGSVAAELGLEVDTGFAKISGTLPVSTGGHEAGSIGRSMCSDAPLSGNAGNEVNGAWNYKYPGYGTNDFKGNVAHGLYEFAEPNKTVFGFRAQVCYQARY